MDQAANNSQRFSAEEGAGPSSIQDSESQDDKNNKLNDTGDVSIIDVVPSSETGGSVNCSSARETASTAVEDDSTTKLPTLMDNENPGPQHGALVQHGLVVHHHDDDVVGGGEVDDIKNDVGFYRETKPACADKTSSAGSPAAGSLSSAVQAVNSKAASSRDVAREMHNQQQHVVAADKVYANPAASAPSCHGPKRSHRGALSPESTSDSASRDRKPTYAHVLCQEKNLTNEAVAVPPLQEHITTESCPGEHESNDSASRVEKPTYAHVLHQAMNPTNEAAAVSSPQEHLVGPDASKSGFNLGRVLKTVKTKLGTAAKKASVVVANTIGGDKVQEETSPDMKLVTWVSKLQCHDAEAGYSAMDQLIDKMSACQDPFMRMKIATALLSNPYLEKVETDRVIEVLQLLLADKTDGETSPEAPGVAKGPAASSTLPNEIHDDGAAMTFAELASSDKASHIIEEIVATAEQDDNHEEQPLDNGSEKIGVEAPSDVRQAGTQPDDVEDFAAKHGGDDNSSSNESQGACTTDARIRDKPHRMAVHDVENHSRPKGDSSQPGALYVAQDSGQNSIKGKKKKTNLEDDSREETIATRDSKDLDTNTDSSDSRRVAQSGSVTAVDSKDATDEQGLQSHSANTIIQAATTNQQSVGTEIADRTYTGEDNDTRGLQDDMAVIGPSTNATTDGQNLKRRDRQSLEVTVNDDCISLDSTDIVDQKSLAQAEDMHHGQLRAEKNSAELKCEALGLAKKELVDAACEWISRCWQADAIVSQAGRSAKQQQKNKDQRGAMVQALESICTSISALVTLPALSGGCISSSLLNSAQATAPFSANDPIELLARVCEVLREQKASALDSTLATKTENQVMSTLDVFAPEVSVALHNICRDIIKSYIVHEALSIKHGEVDNFNGPATRALRTIRENLDLKRSELALPLIREVALAAAGSISSPDLDQAFKSQLVCAYLLEWIDISREKFDGSGMEVWAERIRDGASRIFVDIMNDDIMSGRVQKLKVQGGAIAQLSGTNKATPIADQDARAASLHSKLDASIAALEEFPRVLDRVKVLATVFCPDIGADGAHLAASVIRLREEFKAGALRVQDLSQSFVLKQALDFEHCEAAAVSLHPLEQLVSSKVFRRVWVQLGEKVQHQQQPKNPGDQHREAKQGKEEDEDVFPGNIFHQSVDEFISDGGESHIEDDDRVDDGWDILHDNSYSLSMAESQDEKFSNVGEGRSGKKDWQQESKKPKGFTTENDGESTRGGLQQGDNNSAANSATTSTDVSLTLSVVVRDVLPEALACWTDLLDRMSSGSISSREAWGWFGEGFSAHQRAKQLELMFRAGNDFHRTSSYFSSIQICEALEAHASIEWCLDAIPGLLHAQSVLHSASTAITAGGAKDERTRATSVSNDPAPPENDSNLTNSGSGPGVTDEGETSTVESELPGDGKMRTVDGELQDESSEAPVSRIFVTVPEDDASRAELESIARDLSTRWGHFSLRNAAKAWQKVNEWESSGGHIDHPIFHHTGDGGSLQSGRSDNQLRSAAAFSHPPDRFGLLDRSRAHVNMLRKLAGSPALVRWLLEHPPTKDFKDSLEVCRSCTDDPGLLSSIASLVEIRNRLNVVLFPEKPFNSLCELLGTFSKVHLAEHHPGDTSNLASADTLVMGNEGSLIWHVTNVVARFRSIAELFDKQMVSPGIQALRLLGDILDRGTFVIRADEETASGNFEDMFPSWADGGHGGQSSFSLSLDLQPKAVSEDGDIHVGKDEATTQSGTKNKEDLLGLNARLAIMEIPEGEERRWIKRWGHSARAAVEALKHQLQVMDDILDSVQGLREAGHPYYHGGWEMRKRFELGDEDALREALQGVLLEADTWAAQVTAAREKWPLVNHFTMQDVLRLSNHCMAYGPHAELIEMEDFSAIQDTGRLVLPGADHAIAIQATLRLVLSGAGYNLERVAVWLMTLWRKPHSSSDIDLTDLEKERKTPQRENLLDTFGKALTEALQRESLDMLDHCHGLTTAVARHVPMPLPGTPHLSDSLVASVAVSQGAGGTRDSVEGRGRSGARQQCVFAACAAGPEEVIPVVLSVYVRRGRLPAPGEVVFCTADTTEEELELVVRRFANRRLRSINGFVGGGKRKVSAPNGVGEEAARGDGGLLDGYNIYGGMFVIADVHQLSYSTQGTLLGHLRSKVLEREDSDNGNSEWGGNGDVARPDEDERVAGEAVLLVISGKPRQALLNWLSDHVVELPPLPTDALRESVSHALETHYEGATMAIRSETNGGGKSQYIMKQVATSRVNCYVRVPVGESFSPRDLHRALASHDVADTSAVPRAVHLDLGHVPPLDCNTFLFQLLLEGCVRDPVTREVLVRQPNDLFFVEIPNSECDRVAESLHFCNLLPTKTLEVNPDTLDFEIAEMVGPSVQLSLDHGLKRVHRWLRAVEKGDLLPDGNGLDPADWQEEETDVAEHGCRFVQKEECFELLRRCCCVEGGPSERPTWAVFRTFVRLLSHQLEKVERYPLLSAEVAQRTLNEHGLETFRDVFVRLLIECAKDFSLRSVPQVCLAAVEGSDEESILPGDGQVCPSVDAMARACQRLAARFQVMAGMSNHPVVVFKTEGKPGLSEISGVDILSMGTHRRLTDMFIQDPLKETLQLNGIDFSRDWTSISSEQAVKLLRDIGGVTGLDHTDANTTGSTGYVFTVDNFLKMLSVTQRLQARMPVVISGETGCGKSSLISCMCKVLGWSLDVLNVHSGLSHVDIASWVEGCAINCAARDRDGDESAISVMLLDEINACGSVGLFKEIVCDNTMNGKPLPRNLGIVAACNPYRLRKRAASMDDDGAYEAANNGEGGVVGLANGIRDPIRDLVYRVNPLPESLVDHVMDYGSLQPDTEAAYISAMLKTQLRDEASGATAGGKGHSGYLVDVLARCLRTAQEGVRKINDGERAAVSLRDVDRCIKVFLWLARMWVVHDPSGILSDGTTRSSAQKRSFANFFGCEDVSSRTAAKRAMVLALAYSYLARLRRDDRSSLVRDICAATWAQSSFPHRWLRLKEERFNHIVQCITKRAAENMELGRGVALNEALCENLFILLVSVLNSISMFVVGKPGSSKSLAVTILVRSLKGRESSNSFLRSFPAVEVFSHQCSPQSTSQGILQTFNLARSYHRTAPNTVVLILLDEVGLAERSPHLPLKVLHKILDEAEEGETVVGISNWELDSAKMNRAVNLQRPPPTVDDLELTAKGMLRRDGRDFERCATMLKGIAKAYSIVYKNQRLQDFWGLREFYAAVKFIGRRIEIEGESHNVDDLRKVSCQLSHHSDISPAALALAVLRNFGGRSPVETEGVLKVFFRELLQGDPPLTDQLPAVNELIRDNLAECQQARHLMLLTKNNAALSLLFDLKLLDHRNAEVLFGSDFPGDRTDTQVGVDIQTVKACMARGGTVVLVQCERLYESLYDLLNQHYTECNGRLYSRLAMGSHSQHSPMDPKFRIVVVVESSDAYEKLAPPLLNRFEKQVLGWGEALNLCKPRKLFERLLTRVRSLAVDLAWAGRDASSGSAPDLGTMRRTFPGFSDTFLPSLVLAVSELTHESSGCLKRQHPEIEKGVSDGDDIENETTLEDELYNECKESLLRVATPEAMCRFGRCRGGVGGAAGGELEYAAEYFRTKAYGSLEHFAKYELPIPGKGDHPGCGNSTIADVGTCAMVLTYAPFEGDAGARDMQSTSGRSRRVRHVVIHELSQGRELKAKVHEFFSRDSQDEVLLLQCDLQVSSSRMIEHVKFVVESARATIPQTCPGRSEGTRRSDVLDAQQPSHHRTYVVLLLHLIRGDETFNLAFDTRWRCAFVDSVGYRGWGAGRDRGLPTAVEAAGKSVLEVALGLDPSQAMLGTLRASLAHLAYGRDRLRDMAEVRAQMELLIDVCSGADEVASAFVQTVWESIIDRLRAEELTATASDSVGKLEEPESELGYDDASWEERKGDDAEAQRKQKHNMSRQKLCGAAVRVGTGVVGTDIALGASTDTQLRTAGTFFGAIRISVLGAITQAFSAVLAHMDRNSGLNLLREERLVGLWMELFKVSFRQMPVVAARTHHGDTSRICEARSFGGTRSDLPNSIGADTILGLRGEDRFAVIDSAAGPGESPVHSKFPFSFYIFQLLEGLKTGRRKLGTITGMAEEEALEREFSLLRLDDRLHRKISREQIGGGNGSKSNCCSSPNPFEEEGVATDDEAFLRRYVHDFTCIMLPSVRGMSRVDQASFVLMFLDLARTRNSSSGDGSRGGTEQDGGVSEGRGGAWSPTTSFAGVHHRFWQLEHEIRLSLKLLDAAGLASYRSVIRLVEDHLQDSATTTKVCLSSIRSCGLGSSLHISLARAIQVALLHEDLLAQCVAVKEREAESKLMVEGSAGDWALRVDRADRATTNILALVGSSDISRGGSGHDRPCAGEEQEPFLAELLEGWNKLRLMRKMVLDIIQPLGLGPEATFSALMSLQQVNGCTRSEKFMRAVVTTLSSFLQLDIEHNQSYPGAAVASLRSMEQANMSGVLHQYLESYLFEVTASPRSSSAVCLDQIQPADNNDNIGLNIDEQEEYGMWELLIALLSGDSSFFLERWAEDISKVLPREAACVRILRWLNSKAGRAENAVVTKCLRIGLLREHRRTSMDGDRSISNDTRLAVCFVAAKEANVTVDEVIEVIAGAVRRGRVDSLCEDNLNDEMTGEAMEQALVTVACLRKLACVAAEALCAGNAGVDAHDMFQPLRLLLDALKLVNDGCSGGADVISAGVIAGLGQPGWAREPGMFFLRQVAFAQEGGGEAFLREQLRRPPLNLFSWAASVDSRLCAFAAGDRLPQVNPLARIPLFNECRNVVSAFMDTGDLSTLARGIQQLVDNTTTNAHQLGDGRLRALKGGLLAAVFYEANLVKAMGSQQTDEEHQQQSGASLLLEAWLLHEPSTQQHDASPLAFLSPVERRLVATVIGGDCVATAKAPAIDEPPGPNREGDIREARVARSWLRLGPDSSADEVLWARLAVHVAAAAISADSTSPMAIIFDILFRPEDLRQVFLPTMDSGMTLQQVSAMGQSQGFTSHQCACGYIYAITECGQPMEEKECPEKGCGRILGGLGHQSAQPNSTNVRPREARGYCLDTLDEHGVRTTAMRNMSAEQVATTRLVMHLAGVIAAATDGATWAAKARQMLNTAHVNERPGGGGGIVEIFLRGARENARTLRRLTGRNNEQLTIGVHLSLVGEGGRVTDGEGGDDGALSPAPVHLLQLETGRTAWEAAFCAQHLAVVSGDPEQVTRRLATAVEELRRGGDGNAFAAELLSSGGARNTEPRAVGRDSGSNSEEAIPHARLWAIRHSVSLDSFKEAFKALGSNRAKGSHQKWPLLEAILNDDRRPLLLALARFPSALQWLTILKREYEGRVDLEEVRATTAGRVLQRASAADRASWEAALDGFSQAWRHAHNLVDRFECQDLPSQYARDTVDLDTPVSFFLPSRQDEGVFPLALLMRLGEEHNELVRHSHDARVGGLREDALQLDQVQPEHVAGSHSIVLDVHYQSELLMESQCCGPLSVRRSYDFDKAEDLLAQAAMTRVPIIRFDADEIEFKYREAGTSGDTLLGRLGAKIKQQRLSRADREAIINDLPTPAIANSLLETIDPVISILASVGGSLVQELPPETAEMPLAEFLRDVMRIKGAVQGWEVEIIGGNNARPIDTVKTGAAAREVLPPTVARHVRLKHLVELWELALLLTNREWYSGVSSRFRVELPGKQAQELITAAQHMDLDVLLPLFKNHVREHLVEESIAADKPLKEFLGWVEARKVYLQDTPWFKNHWPEGILMRCALSAFQLLEGRRSIDLHWKWAGK